MPFLCVTEPPSHIVKTTIDYRRRALYLIAVTFVVRLLIAFLSELGNDESYYWLYSQHLQWNYFDHPPMIGWWIRLFTFNLSFQSEGFVRLSSVVSCSIASWFMYQMGQTIHSEKAGWFATLLYNASFYASVTCGIYAMPDSPQMVFWTLSLWMLARISSNDHSWKNWCLFGVAAGSCIMSKIHGVFIWGGLVAFVLFKQRAWLLKPQFYTAALLTAVIISPILFWNIHYDFITYRFHSERVVVKGFPFHADVFIREVWGQILNNNPVSVFLIVAGLLLFKRRKDYLALRIFPFIGIPLSVILIFISMFRNTLPHWNGPAYVTLFPVAAVWLAELPVSNFFFRARRLAMPLFFFVLTGSILVIYFYPGTWGSKKTDYGKGDVTLDMYGWRDAARQFQSFHSHAASGMPATAPMICHYWWGSHIEYYFCRPNGLKMVGLGQPFSLHHYLWMNTLRKNDVRMDSAYCIVPSDEYYYAPWYYRNYYMHIDSVTTFQTYRDGKPAHRFDLFRLTGWKGNAIDTVSIK
jgi:4-amino-4-deoxy-L-arabinose transferase-like glycosyltransferase